MNQEPNTIVQLPNGRRFRRVGRMPLAELTPGLFFELGRKIWQNHEDLPDGLKAARCKLTVTLLEEIEDGLA